jgi:ATP-dependent Clp protease ATP-binding subunit ClpA
MTTNAGVQETVKKSIGFKQQDHTADAMKEINNVFSPEFRNRLDNTVWFDHLNEEVIAQIVDKFIVELQAKLDAKRVCLEVSQDARKWLAENGYDKSMGARPMARLIQEELKKKLANELLFGELTQGGVAKVGVRKSKLVINYESKKEVVTEK